MKCIPLSKTIDADMVKIAVEAILKHPKAKLYAKVNPEDKFQLAMHPTAQNAILGEFIEQDDLGVNITNWYNNICANKFKKMEELIATACKTAYTSLTK
jgi:hypothetical protein